MRYYYRVFRYDEAFGGNLESILNAEARKGGRIHTIIMERLDRIILVKEYTEEENKELVAAEDKLREKHRYQR